MASSRCKVAKLKFKKPKIKLRLAILDAHARQREMDLLSDTHGAFADNNDRLQQIHAGLQERHNAIKSKLVQEKQNAKKIERQRDSYGLKCAELELHVTQLRQDNGHLVDDTRMLRDRESQLQAELSECHSQHEQLQKTTCEQQASLKDLRKKLSSLLTWRQKPLPAEKIRSPLDRAAGKIRRPQRSNNNNRQDAVENPADPLLSLPPAIGSMDDMLPFD
ncbi:MAG: hypothetical protein Q9210_003442 [Variospora velana]